MALLQVRNCPDDIYNKIAVRAKQQNRTIAQQVLVVLQKGLNLDQPNIERRKKLIEKINQRNVPPKVMNIDDVRLIREDRDR